MSKATSLGVGTPVVEGDPMKEVTVTQVEGVRQRVRFPCNPTTDQGQPAPVDGDIVCINDDPTQPVTCGNVDPKNPWISVPPDFFGNTEGNIVGDADLTPNQPDGAGIEKITERYLVHWVHPKATSLGVSDPVVELA